MWPMTPSNFSFLLTILSRDDPQKYLYWSDGNVLHMQLWRPNKGTYDVIKKNSHSFPMRSTCDVPSFNFFLGAVSEMQRSKVFSVFPTWLPHRMIYDIMIINDKTFYMTSRSSGENFVSIRQAVAEKNTKVLCGQTNRPKCNTPPLASVTTKQR